MSLVYYEGGLPPALTATTVAATLARRVLPYFEHHFPGNDRPRRAIEAAEAFIRTATDARSLARCVGHGEMAGVLDDALYAKMAADRAFGDAVLAARRTPVGSREEAGLLSAAHAAGVAKSSACAAGCIRVSAPGFPAHVTIQSWMGPDYHQRQAEYRAGEADRYWALFTSRA